MTSGKVGVALRCIGVFIAVSVAIFDLAIWQMFVVAFGVGLAQIGVAIQYKEFDNDPRS